MTTRTRIRRKPTAAKLAELGVAAPAVVAHRLTRMALASPAALSQRDRREFTGMVLEKQLAFAQAWTAMAMQALRLQQQFWLACFTGRMPSSPAQAIGSVFAKGLAPIHGKAVSNSRRLARTRLR